MTDKDNSGFKPGSIPIYEAPDGTRFYREADLQPEIRAQLRKQRADPYFERQLKDQSGVLHWQYAVTNNALPEGADAAAVRSSDPNELPILVFSNGSLSDRLVSLARIALLHDRGIKPTLKSTQVMLIWADGTTKVNGVEDKLERLTLTEEGESAKFRARGGPVRNIEGIGEVRIVGNAEDF